MTEDQKLDKITEDFFSSLEKKQLRNQSRMARGGKFAGKTAYAGGKKFFHGVESMGNFARDKFNPALNKAMSPVAKMANSRFVPGFATLASTGFGLYSGISNYDPTKHESRVHEGFKNVVADEGFAVIATQAAFGIHPLLGLGVIASEIAGVGASTYAREAMNSAGLQYDQVRHGTRAPIQQNENTMRATTQNLNLLGQAGYGSNEIINPQSFGARKRGLLGSEAMLMHN